MQFAEARHAERTSSVTTANANLRGTADVAGTYNVTGTTAVEGGTANFTER